LTVSVRSHPLCISRLFQVADPEPDEPHLFLQFKSVEAIEGGSPDFRLRIRKFIKGFRSGIGLKIVKPHLHRHRFTLIAFFLHAANDGLDEFHKVLCD